MTDRVQLVAVFDVTNLSDQERNALAFEISVQAETSDYVGEDGHGWIGHTGVPEPQIWTQTIDDNGEDVTT